MATNKKKSAAKKVPAEVKKPAVAKKPKVINEQKKIESVQEALFMFQAEKLVLPRNGEGKASSGKVYKYVTLDDMIQIAGPVLQKYGLGFTQLVQTDKMETKLFHFASGTEMSSMINLGSPNNMQDYGGRITYAKRYALGAILGLSSEEDVDATPIPEAKAPTTGAALQAAPEKPAEVAPAEKKEDAPAAPNVVRSENFTKAKTAIDTAYSAEALEMISGQIDRSTRLSDEEKVELKALLKARDTEVNGTIHH